MGQIFTVVSGKGGAGKSTVSAGIARLLAKKGLRVLLVDTDGGICSAELLLEQGDKTVFNGADVLNETASVRDALLSVAGSPDFLAAPNRPYTQDETMRLAVLVQQLATEYDVVMVDRPAGLDFTFESALCDATGLVVSTPDELALRGAQLARCGLEEAGCDAVYLVINRFLPRLIRKKIMPNIDTLCDRVGARLLGIVPEDLNVVNDVAKGRVTASAPYQKALVRMTGRLLGERIPLPNLKKLLK